MAIQETIRGKLKSYYSDRELAMEVWDTETEKPDFINLHEWLYKWIGENVKITIEEVKE